MNLLDLLRTEGSKFLQDAMPGGALNPEITRQGLLDTLAIGTAPVPVAGDIAGLAADVNRMVQNPEERTMGNAALAGLGLLPFVPSLGTVRRVGNINTSYRGAHTAPGPDFGAPLHDLTGGGQMYPADVYSPRAAQFYGTGYPAADREAFDLARRVRGNPDAEVTMYRAVPKDVTDINEGDWVTLSKQYAKTHGESVLGKDYRIVGKKVKAKDLYTNADSIHEFGYYPQQSMMRRK
jgi:hypothetical protein